MRSRFGALVVALSIASLGASCGSQDGSDAKPATTRAAGAASSSGAALPQAGDPVDLESEGFTTRIDNPYWPMAPGNRWVYREGHADGTAERIEVTVTNRTREVDGVTARVIHDVATKDGALIEDTFDWYAQDEAGNIWYLGEDTKEYENGKVSSTHGSWESGVDGAQAGVIMPAHPEVGMGYRQEYYAGEAEDAARVLSLDARVAVPAGRFEGALKTLDYTPLQPNAREHKYYAKGVGPVLATSASGPGPGGGEQLLHSNVAR
jgi:hypothetical protein